MKIANRLEAQPCILWLDILCTQKREKSEEKHFGESVINVLVLSYVEGNSRRPIFHSDCILALGNSLNGYLTTYYAVRSAIIRLFLKNPIK